MASIASSPTHDCRRVCLQPKYGDGVREVELSYLWTGATGAPTIIVQGGISAGRNVCAADTGRAGWWDRLVGAGNAIDLTQWRVLSIDWLDADALGAVAVSSEDQADALAALLEVLGIGRVHAFVGASYGAMVGLAFAARHPRRVQQLIALAGAHRPHALASAQRVVQRGILRLGINSGREGEALGLARQLAMTTYRGSAEFAQRFAGGAEFLQGRFRLPVEDWLERVGEQAGTHFSAQRYLALSESIDLHDIEPCAIHVPTTLIGFASDRLVPLGDLCELQRELGVVAALHVVESAFGHDGFLKEHARLAPLLREALDCNADDTRRSA